ncbi:MAG TPA: hypothetical protein VL860_02790, partial [Planctomycetota bacterium]|nr:hypothetical protein [Planctomycetota bacterium]
MPVLANRPITVIMPSYGIVVAESVHAPEFRMADRAESFHKIVLVQAGEIQYTAVGSKPAQA